MNTNRPIVVTQLDENGTVRCRRCFQGGLYYFFESVDRSTTPFSVGPVMVVASGWQESPMQVEETFDELVAQLSDNKLL